MFETAHQRAHDLIPWMVNDTIAAADRSILEQHLTECTACRNELSQQQRLRDSMRQSMPIDRVPSASLNRLWLAIDADSAADESDAAIATTQTRMRPPPGQRGDRTNRRVFASPTVSWLAAAVIVEAIGITWLVGAQLNANTATSNTDSETFRTVSTETSATRTGAIRAVFSPDMNLAALDALLKQHGMQIVGGPTSAGVYTLATSAQNDALENTLTALRAQSNVRFAERIDAAK